ncbi:hypothetical protein N790_13240 [Arenimonas malthae CC-JY-1]|uniref:Uncharacterized protein n=1 Tax=Arenimonas malthae CC-JY-1 TaxID=1384054 RepID=A0A091C5T4_9GAMM|nr:hypothetical protein [Arenimonas malthae]KFN51980.1 hypothetical protein N790_13240 [Arenimonas malthae CC-JY-1]
MTAAEEAGPGGSKTRAHEPLTQCLLLAAAVDGVREMVARSALFETHPGIGIEEASHHLNLAAAYLANALQVGDF